MTADLENARARELAKTSFLHALRENWEKAVEDLVTLDKECGPTGVELALCAWCDTTLSVLPDPGERPVQWAWGDIDTGQMGWNSQDLPPRNRWAFHMISARQALDFNTWDALLQALPTDSKEIGDHVIALLEACSITYKKHGGRS
jgi:hypothetical protein